jgi:dissimilatory sulfite reductase (desulfoviridin) alpha/beta subunit
MSRDAYRGTGFELKLVERSAARRLITVPKDHYCWISELSETALAASIVRDFGELRGAIVRMQIPAIVTDQTIRRITKIFQDCGVSAVRIASRDKHDVLPSPAESVRATCTMREVVMEMALASTRREELARLLDECLTKAGV